MEEEPGGQQFMGLQRVGHDCPPSCIIMLKMSLKSVLEWEREDSGRVGKGA